MTGCIACARAIAAAASQYFNDSLDTIQVRQHLCQESSRKLHERLRVVRDQHAPEEKLLRVLLEGFQRLQKMQRSESCRNHFQLSPVSMFCTKIVACMDSLFHPFLHREAMLHACFSLAVFQVFPSSHLASPS